MKMADGLTWQQAAARVGEVCRRRWLCRTLASEEAAPLLRAPTGWVGDRLLHAEVGGNRCGGRGAAKERWLRRCECRGSWLPSVALSAGENGTVSGPFYVCAHHCRCLNRLGINSKRYCVCTHRLLRVYGPENSRALITFRPQLLLHGESDIISEDIHDTRE